MIWLKLLFFIFLQRASGFDLDDLEYDKMPQISRLDDYHRCILHNGTYCLVVVDVFADPPNDLMKMIKEYSRERVTHFNHSHLERGVCVTGTCRKYIGTKNLRSSGDLHDILTTCLNNTFWNQYELQASVTSQICTSKEETDENKIDLSDWMMLLIIVAVFAFNIMGTLLDVILDDKAKKKQSKSQKILMCFSLVRNWEYMKRTSQNNERLQALKGLHAIRTAGAFSVISGHAALLSFTFIGNPHDYEKAFSKLHYSPTMNGAFVVHIFFVIASFLLVYNLEIAGEKQRLTWKTVPLILTHRFFRMIPPLLLVVAFSATWMRHIGTGPLWGKYVLAVSDQCRSYWWTHLLFINNYVFDNQLCNIQTWHLAADTQLFFLGLVIYLVVQKRIWFRNLMLFLMLLMGIVFPALHVYWYDLDVAFIFKPEFMRFFYSGSFNLLNVYAHTNMTCYAIGMYTGYKVIEWQRKGVSFDNRKIYVLLNSVGPIIAVVMFGLTYFHKVDTPLWSRMLVQATIRLVIGSCAALMIIGIAMRVNNFRSLLEWNGWVIFGKVNFSVYLVHLNLVHVLLGLQMHLVDLHYLPFLMYAVGVTGLSYLIAVPFYLMVEAPLNPVLKVLITSTNHVGACDSFLSEVMDARHKVEDKCKQKPMRENSRSPFEEPSPNTSFEKLKAT